MLTKQNIIVALLLMGAPIAAPAAAETYQLSVEAFSPMDVPLDTQTAECPSVQKSCFVSFTPLSGKEPVRVIVRERQPGVLAITAEQGLDTLAVEQMLNERGITAEVIPTD